MESLRAALEAVVDPVFEQPVGQLGTLRLVEERGGRPYAEFTVAAPGLALQRTLREAAERAASEAGFEGLQVGFSLEVPTREPAPQDAMPQVRNILLVTAGKGGVGKSTVAANLACSLALEGARVGLLDADVYGPSVPLMLGLEGPAYSKDGKRIEPMRRRVLPERPAERPEGGAAPVLEVMSIGFMLDDVKQAVIWRGPMLHGALQQLLTDVAWGELDYMVVDMPPGTGDVALTIAQRCPGAMTLLVTTPQEVALHDVYKAVTMARKLSLPVLGVVENLAWFVDPEGRRHELFGRGGGAKVAEYAEAPLLGQVPLQPSVREAGDGGRPIVEAEPDSEAAEALRKVARQVALGVARQHFERTGARKAPPGRSRRRLPVVS